MPRLVKSLLAATVALGFASLAFGASLVQEGRVRAEIVIREDALPQVAFAARELRDHIAEMTGAALPIVHAPTDGKTPVYVGESEHTKRLGLDTEGMKMEGYRVVATDDYLALMGRDAVFPRYPRGHTSRHVRPDLLKEWQEHCGAKWDFPFLHIYDPRNENAELGFSLYDPTGTLFAVYDFLERLGVRWYMPYHEFGTVVPKRKSIEVNGVDESANPVFASRYMRFGWASDTEGFLWFKRQKLGMSEMPCIYHGTPNVTQYTKAEHPEYLSVIDGKLQTQDWADDTAGHPRLAPPLRDAMVAYARKFFDRYPELRHVSSAPADGYIAIDDRDRAAGWWREDRGRRGLMSDYVWRFVNGVAKGLAETHPDKIVMGLAYSTYRLPPEDIGVLEPNLGVTFCQTRATEMISPEDRQAIFKQREEWLEKLPSGEFYQWEYCLYYTDRRGLSGVPVVFSAVAQEDIQALAGKSRGEYVEAYPQSRSLWGLKHMPFYLQARLYWDPYLDLDAFMEEYCETFYGPARAEMREFFDFAEEVWMRPKSRDVLSDDSFLQPEDVDRFFDILSRARAKAEGDFAKRIDLLAEECAPMKEMFAFQANHEKGMAAVEAKDGEAAARHLRLAAEQARDTRSRANAWYDLGNACRDLLQDNEKALDAYRRCMDTNLKGAGSAVRRHARMAAVGILRQEKRFDEAVELLDLEGAQRHDFWKIQTLVALGEIAEDRGDLTTAAARYNEALAVEGIRPAQAENLRERLGAISEKDGNE